MKDYYNFVFLGTVLSASGCTCTNDKLDKLNMNDVLHKLPHYFKANETQAFVDRNTAIDMSKLSDAVLNETIHRIRIIHENITGYNASAVKENVYDIEMNDSRMEIFNSIGRKLSKKTRRQARQSLPWHGRDKYWDDASDWITRQKILDCMLTLVYMARHHVKAMVKTLSNKRDSSYRLAYLFSKLETLHGKVKLIYNEMLRKADFKTWNEETNKKIETLYKKALKIHSEFNLYYFIMSRMHNNEFREFINTYK